jgi:imidazolonepropionase
MSFTLFRDAQKALTLSGASHKEGRGITEADLSIVEKPALIVKKGVLVWVGPQKNIPKEFHKKISKEISLKNKLLTPGFVECHTHTVFAGSRASEFNERLNGVSYQEIAKRGGGILSTMNETRKASSQHLLNLAQQRVNHFLTQGVTTLEVKSGYALNLKDELKTVKVIESLKGPKIVSTFLGAHAIPPEAKSAEEYLNELVLKVLPVIKTKTSCRRVDIFVEKGFFESSMAKDYLQKAKELGFEAVIHADQLSLSGGADLAVELNSISADHLIKVDQAAIAKLARSNVTSVLLPSADLYMRCDYPPARALIDGGARVALATDFNPGSSPSQDISLVGVLARLKMKMSLPEVLAAYTVGAAHALNLQTQKGSLEAGKDADVLAWDCDWTQLFYEIGSALRPNVYALGKKLVTSKV